jgi:hypothetical protein
MTTNATPTPSSAEHDAAMIAKVDANVAAAKVTPVAAAETPASTERPAWLPAEFETPEAFVEDYNAKKAAADAQPDAAAEAARTAEAAEAAKVAAGAGLNYDDLTAEYGTAGELSADSYAKLEAAGIPKNLVDSYIAGQQAIADSFEASVMDTAGGKSAFDAMSTWAGANLPKAEVAAFNRNIDAAVASGDLAAAKLAIAGLKAAYTEANGEAPKLLGGGNSNEGTDVFRSMEELKVAMRDPRYSRDPAYRSDVEAKLNRSKIM